VLLSTRKDSIPPCKLRALKFRVRENVGVDKAVSIFQSAVSLAGGSGFDIKGLNRLRGARQGGGRILAGGVAIKVTRKGERMHLHSWASKLFRKGKRRASRKHWVGC